MSMFTNYYISKVSFKLKRKHNYGNKYENKKFVKLK